jgi:hypothetical protein
MNRENIAKGDIVEINGRRGVVCHLTARRAWVLHDGDRIATGYSRSKIRRAFLLYGLHGDNLVRSFSDRPQVS